MRPRSQISFGTCLPMLAAGLALVVAGGAVAGERIAGPVEGDIVRVRDGDTIEVRAQVWPGVAITVGARIRGIDTPEIHGDCRYEKMIAAAAMGVLSAATISGKVRLTNIEEDKYAGRVIADVATDAGTDLARVMMASGLARSYDGGGRGPWCGIASLGG